MESVTKDSPTNGGHDAGVQTDSQRHRGEMSAPRTKEYIDTTGDHSEKPLSN